MTQKLDKRTPVDRLNYTGSLEPVIGRLNMAYGIGKPQDFSVIGVGYEDCNVIVETGQGKYVAKIFQKGRTPEEITRYIVCHLSGDDYICVPYDTSKGD